MGKEYDVLEEDFRDWIKKIKTHYDFAISLVKENDENDVSEVYFSIVREGYDSFTEYLPVSQRKRLDKILKQEGIYLKRIGIEPVSMFQSFLIFLGIE